MSADNFSDVYNHLYVTHQIWFLNFALGMMPAVQAAKSLQYTVTNNQVFGNYGAITTTSPNNEKLAAPRHLCTRSLFYVRAQRVHPVNRRVCCWALFQMTEIEQRNVY